MLSSRPSRLLESWAPGITYFKNTVLPDDEVHYGAHTFRSLACARAEQPEENTHRSVQEGIETVHKIHSTLTIFKHLLISCYHVNLNLQILIETAKG